MDYILGKHYNEEAEIDEYSKTLVCEMHAVNSKIIDTIDTLIRDCPEVEREETKKKELLLQDPQLLILETSLMARSELSQILLRRSNISTHCH